MDIREFLLIEEAMYQWNKVSVGGTFVLTQLGRVGLLSTFFEDAYRTACYYMTYEQYLSRRYGAVVYQLVLLITIVGQAAPPVLILVRVRVRTMCLLMAVSRYLLRVISFTHSPPRLPYMLASVAPLGGLLLLAAEAWPKTKARFHDQILHHAAHPSDRLRSAVLLFARLLLLLLVVGQLTAALPPSSAFGWLTSAAAVTATVLVAAGWQTSTAAAVLGVYLTAVNATANAYWTLDWADEYDAQKVDYLRYRFFQNLSVVGSLVLLVLNGPGEFSADHYYRGKWKPNTA